ncbi:cyclic nucleotide-binding domain-containing protein [Winogradskyella sp. 3972H.M.0a.05]|uniref:Crp/Fnr family transcriptional regulator n=1 Tax=Winogradskyella sp. 3972H.M.0a.05 TaxID=2950277 RepID=UPI0033943CBC
MIPVEILENYNATLKQHHKGDVLFIEGETAQFYFQISSGNIKMFNLTEDGKEFVQGYFEDGQAFAEPPLFGDFEYPASSICTKDTSIYVLPKEVFFEVLKAYPEIHLNFTKLLSKRMFYKAKIMKEVSVYPPEHRIMTLLNHLKQSSGSSTLYEVELTRQQISELTGLRVETVIRAIKKLESSKKLYIKERKVYI